MSDSVREKVLISLVGVLKPIARFLLRVGIGFREFSDIAKAAFVEVATEEYGIRGRPTNISRVAVMTGLTRKEVKRIRDLGFEPREKLIPKRNPLSELLHYWNTDPDYCDVDGKPKPLFLDGSTISFSDLVRRCAGDIPPGAMRTELKRVGAISEDENGALIVNTREHLPNDADHRLLVGINFGLRTLASTIAVNGNPDADSTLPQKYIDSAFINPKEVSEIQEILTKKISAFAADIDDFLSEHEEDSREVDAKKMVSIGVGIYFHKDDEKTN
jgi:hypothetical protein